MKTRLLIIIMGILTGTAMMMFAFDDEYNSNTNNAYGMWFPLSPEALIEESKTVFVGTITAIAHVDVEYQSQIARDGTRKDSVGPEVMTLEEYTVSVEAYLKNPQNSDTMKVLSATVGGVPSGPARISGFDIGDRVLFYLPKDEKQTHFPMQYLPESFEIPKQCDAKSVLKQPKIDGANDFKIMQDGIILNDNFIADKPIQFVYNKDMRTLEGESFDVDIIINKIVDKNNKQIIVQENIHTESKPCEWISTAIWEFVPTAGKYSMLMHTSQGNSTGEETSGRNFTVIENISEPNSNQSQIENIDGILYYVSKSFMPNSSIEKIIFHDVEFSPPYRYDPPRYAYTDVTFSDGTEETLRVLWDYPTFTEHIQPQAGFTETFDGIRFLVSIDLKELSPLKQFKSGILLNEIQCRESLTLVTKHDGSPACVKPETISKLIQRGWTTVDFSKEKIKVEKITGAKILDVLFDDKSKSILIQMDSFSEGYLTITIPRNVLDSKVQGEDDEFFILVDGKEVNFKEIKNKTKRTFTIQFESGAKEIEITMPLLAYTR